MSNNTSILEYFQKQTLYANMLFTVVFSRDVYHMVSTCIILSWATEFLKDEFSARVAENQGSYTTSLHPHFI